MASTTSSKKRPHSFDDPAAKVAKLSESSACQPKDAIDFSAFEFPQCVDELPSARDRLTIIIKEFGWMPSLFGFVEQTKQNIAKYPDFGKQYAVPPAGAQTPDFFTMMLRALYSQTWSLSREEDAPLECQSYRRNFCKLLVSYAECVNGGLNTEKKKERIRLDSDDAIFLRTLQQRIAKELIGVETEFLREYKNSDAIRFANLTIQDAEACDDAVLVPHDRLVPASRRCLGLKMPRHYERLCKLFSQRTAPEEYPGLRIHATWLSELDRFEDSLDPSTFMMIYTALPTPPAHVAEIIEVCGKHRSAHCVAQMHTPLMLRKLIKLFVTNPEQDHNALSRRQPLTIPEDKFAKKLSQGSSVELIDFSRFGQLARIAQDYVERLELLQESGTILPEECRLLKITPHSLYVDSAGRLVHLPNTTYYKSCFGAVHNVAAPGKRLRHALLVSCVETMLIMMYGWVPKDVQNHWLEGGVTNLSLELRVKASLFPRISCYGTPISPLIIDWFLMCLTNKIETRDIATHAAFYCMPQQAYQSTIPTFMARGNDFTRQFRLFESLMNRERYLPLELSPELARFAEIYVFDEGRAEGNLLDCPVPTPPCIWQQLVEVPVEFWHLERLYPNDLDLRFVNETGYGTGVTKEVVQRAFDELRLHSCFVYHGHLDMLMFREISGDAPCAKCATPKCVFSKHKTWDVFAALVLWIPVGRMHLTFRLAPEILFAFVESRGSATVSQRMASERLVFPDCVDGVLDLQNDRAKFLSVLSCDVESASVYLLEKSANRVWQQGLLERSVTRLVDKTVVALAMRTAFTSVDALSRILTRRSLQASDAFTVPVTAEHVYASLVSSLENQELAESRILITGNLYEYKDLAKMENKLAAYFDDVEKEAPFSGLPRSEWKLLHYLDLLASPFAPPRMHVFHELKNAELRHRSLVYLCRWIVTTSAENITRLYVALFGRSKISREESNRMLQSFDYGIACIYMRSDLHYMDACTNELDILAPRGIRHFRVQSALSKDPFIPIHVSVGSLDVFSNYTRRLPAISSCHGSISLGVGYRDAQDFDECMEHTLANATYFTSE